jgi:hypothetical protein
MTSVRGCCLALACLCILCGRGQACYGPMPPGELVRRSPVIVTGTIVRIEPDARGREWAAVAHVRVKVVHRNALSDVTVEPGGTLRVITWRENTGRTTELSNPVGTTAIWFAWVDEDGSLSIALHPAQCQQQELGPVPADNARYTTAEWVARLEKAVRWRYAIRGVERDAYEIFATVGLWNNRKDAPTYGWALVLASLALFVALASRLRQRRSRVRLRFPASVKRL